MVLQRAHQNLRDRFTAIHGPGSFTVAEFTASATAGIEIVDLTELPPQLRL